MEAMEQPGRTIVAAAWTYLDASPPARRRLDLLSDGLAARFVAYVGTIASERWDWDEPLATEWRREMTWRVECYEDGTYDIVSGRGVTTIDPAAWREPARVAAHIEEVFGDRLHHLPGANPGGFDGRRRRVTRWWYRLMMWFGCALASLMLMLLAWVVLGGVPDDAVGWYAAVGGILISLVALPAFVAMIRDGRRVRSWDAERGGTSLS